jgi:hypothetical protein
MLPLELREFLDDFLTGIDKMKYKWFRAQLLSFAWKKVFNNYR